MEDNSRGKIRKITVGLNPKDGKAIVVGQSFHLGSSGRSEVIEIINDSNFFKQTAKEKFLIIMKNDKNVPFVWGEVTDMPTWIEYDDPKEEPVKIH